MLKLNEIGLSVLDVFGQRGRAVHVPVVEPDGVSRRLVATQARLGKAQHLVAVGGVPGAEPLGELPNPTGLRRKRAHHRDPHGFALLIAARTASRTALSTAPLTASSTALLTASPTTLSTALRTASNTASNTAPPTALRTATPTAA